MADEAPPYWVLISVLFSSIPLTPALAMSLHQTAYELYRHGGGVGEVMGELVSGKVKNLKKDVLVGTIGGPMFEAELDTERGAAQVRFVLTRQGLELLAAKEQATQERPRQYLN